MRVLAGDVGGTNARLAIVEMDDAGARTVAERDYPSGDYDGLATIVEKFLADTGAAAERGCIAIAGPVVDGRAQATNLPWTVDGDALGRAARVAHFGLINDFFAVGIGIDLLGAEDVVTLQRGQPAARGPVGYLGAGTGLGVGFRLWSGDGYRVYPSEGGHVDFAPRSDVQQELLRFLRDKYGRASNERILSGNGIADLYRFLALDAGAAANPAIEREMNERDPAAVVTDHALAGDDMLCVRAVELFVRVLGAVAGNLALVAVATGGIYIAGGIAPRIVDKLTGSAFLEAFNDQGRLSTLVASAPVHVITNTKVGLLGAARYAARH